MNNNIKQRHRRAKNNYLSPRKSLQNATPQSTVRTNHAGFFCGSSMLRLSESRNGVRTHGVIRMDPKSNIYIYICI